MGGNRVEDTRMTTNTCVKKVQCYTLLQCQCWTMICTSWPAWQELLLFEEWTGQASDPLPGSELLGVIGQ